MKTRLQFGAIFHFTFCIFHFIARFMIISLKYSTAFTILLPYQLNISPSTSMMFTPGSCGCSSSA